MCARMSVYSSASRLGALRALGLHTTCLPGTGLVGLREEAQTMKVFAFRERQGRAGTHFPPAPRRGLLLRK